MVTVTEAEEVDAKLVAGVDGDPYTARRLREHFIALTDDTRCRASTQCTLKQCRCEQGAKMYSSVQKIDRNTDRKADRQTDSQTVRQTDRQTDGDILQMFVRTTYVRWWY